MSNDFYILDENHQVVSVSLTQYAAWVERGARRVAETRFNGLRISTVFLGLDHNFGHGPSKWFETMVFPGDGFQDLYCDRYTTWDEAVAGHKKAVAMVEAGEITSSGVKEDDK